MTKIVYLILSVQLCLILVLSRVESKCERHNEVEIKTYKIDLDQPARLRFKEVVSDFKKQIVDWFNFEKKRFDFKYFPIVEFIASELDNFFPYPFNEELRGIADALQMNLGDVVLTNLVYDLTAYCTSIVSEKSDGQIIHGRNLDYDFPEQLQNITYIAQFYRNGSLLFTSAQLAGFIGVVTGHKYQSFTFSINERDQGEWWVNFLYGFLDKKATPLSFITRDLMENMTSFNEAVNLMSKTDLIAPAYFIIGGVNPGEGVVITRNQSSVVDTWKLDFRSTGIESWYLLETNYDHWLPPSPNDDRRTPGMKAMNDMGQSNLNTETLFDVLSINPVCNG